MKNLILVSLILQLVITINVINGYKFGDIIAFPRVTAYKHYAIYVGPKSGIDVGQGDNDIFHRSGRLKKNCVFGKLSETEGKSGHRVENYLDNVDNFTVGTDAQIKERIMSANGNCVTYWLFANNCEHLATWVRYNKAHSVQKGTLGESIISLVNKCQNKDKLKKILEKVNEDEDGENACATPHIS